MGVRLRWCRWACVAYCCLGLAINVACVFRYNVEDRLLVQPMRRHCVREGMTVAMLGDLLPSQRGTPLS